MILTKKHIPRERISEKEYRALRSRISYSDLKLLDTDREKFYKINVLGEKKIEKKSASLLLGDLVHTILGGVDGSFDEKFVLSQTTAPTGQIGELVEKLYTRTLRSIVYNDEGEGIQQDSFDTLFTDALQQTQYNYKGEAVTFKDRKGGVKSKEVVLEMFQATGEMYYKECIENIGRSVVSIVEIERAEKLANKVKEHRFTSRLTIQPEGNVEVHNEEPILFSKEGVEYRSMPDRKEINHDTKVIDWEDWKTTWSAEDGVVGSYLKHGYYLQAAMYSDAIRYWANENGMEDYTVNPPTFVFIDTGGWQDPCLFKLTKDDVERAHRGFTYRGRRYKGLDTIKKDLEWHLETGIWTSDREIYLNKGYLKNPIRYGSI